MYQKPTVIIALLNKAFYIKLHADFTVTPQKSHRTIKILGSVLGVT